MDDYGTDTLFDTDPEADDNALSAPDEDASDDEGSGTDRESNREGSDTEEVKFLRSQRQCSLVVSLMKQSISLQEDDVPEVKRRRRPSEIWGPLCSSPSDDQCDRLLKDLGVTPHNRQTDAENGVRYYRCVLLSVRTRPLCCYNDMYLLQLHQMWHTRSISTMPIPYQDGAGGRVERTCQI
jgi:hypothetical protein